MLLITDVLLAVVRLLAAVPLVAAVRLLAAESLVAVVGLRGAVLSVAVAGLVGLSPLLDCILDCSGHWLGESGMKASD